MYRPGVVAVSMASLLWLGACTGTGEPTSDQTSRGASLDAELGNDFSGNYLWVHGLRSVASDAKYPCLNEVTACLALDKVGKSEALADLCPSIDTPEGTWTFEHGLFADKDCTQPLANLKCIVNQGATLAPGHNRNPVECLTDNALNDFKVCIYDPATKAGFGSCNPVSCVYTNNDATPNSVSAFKVDNATGSLTAAAGSPFAAAGNGSPGGLYGSNRVVAQLGRYLYASNATSGTISAFAIDPFTCSLTPVAASPFPAEPFSWGVSLATTPDGKYLDAGTAARVFAYAVAPDGSLSPLAPPTYTLSGPTDGMKVSPDGRFLAIGTLNVGMTVFAIAADGSLAPVAGSPFAVDPRGTATGVDINCASNLLFVAENYSPPLVDVFAIADDGSLSPSGGTAYTFPGGLNSNVAVLSPDDRFLFVSNQSSKTITVASVGAGGSLTAVAGSPFAAGVYEPAGMATDAAGQFLYAASWYGTVAGFSVGYDGSLNPVPGSPFASPGYPMSLTVFPPKSCK